MRCLPKLHAYSKIPEHSRLKNLKKKYNLECPLKLGKINVLTEESDFFPFSKMLILGPARAHIPINLPFFSLLYRVLNDNVLCPPVE